MSHKSKKRNTRIGASIKKDAIHPRDYLRYRMPSSCEDCSHFKLDTETCTLGFPTAPHLQRHQDKSYTLNGKIAICRFIEID